MQFENTKKKMLILTGRDHAFHLLSFIFIDDFHAIVQKTTLQLVLGSDIPLLIYKLCLLRKRKKHSLLPVILSLFFNYHHQREKALMPRRNVHIFSTTKKFINV